MGVSMSKLTEIFLSLSHLRKCNCFSKKSATRFSCTFLAVQLHFLHFFNILKHFFVSDLDLRKC
jgi:hypothetical protein